MKEDTLLLGFDIGGTKIALSLGDARGNIRASARIDNVDTTPEEVTPLMISMARKMVEESGASMHDVGAFGISSPGPADYRNGVMTHPTNNLKWHNVPIRQIVSDGLGLPGFFENDANCAMLAEWFFGAAKGAQDAIYLTMSTGIGAGIIAAGHLVTGRCGQAGEVGHVVLIPGGIKCNCGLSGCYEAYCGGKAIAARMRRELAETPDAAVVRFAGSLENVDMVALEKAVRIKDAYAVRLWDEIMRLNAQAIGGFINSLNPEKVVLGTFAWAIGDLFMEPLLRYVPQFAWREMLDVCDIVPSALKRDIGAYAGIAAALNGLYELGEFDLPR
ncbi:MAG: ROK family protein [Victivallaceae bacterium]|nr:ROK family protein [Victivallaceae bacterium]